MANSFNLVLTLAPPLTNWHSSVAKYSNEGQKRHLRRPTHSKDLTKLAILPDYKHPRMFCLALRPCQKVLLYERVAKGVAFEPS